MKAVDFPAATPMAASSCETLSAPLSTGTESDVFAQVMDQAMGDAQAEAGDSSDSNKDVLVDPDAQPPLSEEPEANTASHWLAALIVPLVTPPMAKATAAFSSESNAMTSLSMSEEQSTEGNSSLTGTDRISFEPTLVAEAPTAQARTVANPNENALPLSNSVQLQTGEKLGPTVSAEVKSSRTTENAAPAPREVAEALKPFGGANLKVDSSAKPLPNLPLSNGTLVLNSSPSAEAKLETVADETGTTEVAGQNIPLEVVTGAPMRPRNVLGSQTAPKAAQIEGSAESAGGGTSGAKYVPPTKTAENMNEFTGSSEQNLPGAATLEAPTPGRISRSPSSAVALKAETVGAASIELPANNHRAEEATTTTVTATGPITTRSMERTEDLMALHGLRLRDSGLDSMRVVIKPDSNLHIALNVQMRDNGVEITAQLQRGDHELMSRHWPELQQQLEQRGIRLAPLTQSESNASSNQNQNNNSFSQHSNRHHHEDRQTRSGAFAEFALESVLVPKRAAKATIPRGWESWA
jgi:hypothetical protein